MPQSASESRGSAVFSAGGHQLPLGKRTYILGILNLTPDSFSDGGRFDHPDQAADRIKRLADAGADILDIGAESTRPGSLALSAKEETTRLLPVLETARRLFSGPISVDTYKPEVAEAALAAGVDIINDIYGLHQDDAMAALLGKSGAGVILMHNARFYRLDSGRFAGQAIHAEAEEAAEYQKLSLQDAVQRYLQESVRIAERAGISRNRLILDPGIGFAVDTEESLTLLRQIADLRQLGLPVLSGPSRKRFIGDLTGRPVDQREFGTAAAVACSIMLGADFVRVHDVAAARDTVRVCDALVRPH
ncbi:MAG: dihydropteroate synthase [Clostridia bacterium]|nr:dihydropteroate synthase [Eubacteriales bacterium]NCC47503.1 dihydropteroate synthase [Clostridia bacterium]